LERQAERPEEAIVPLEVLQYKATSLIVSEALPVVLSKAMTT
jgi:hypothetical protein